MLTVLLHLVLGCGFAYLAYWIIGLILVIFNQLFNIKRVGPITMYPKSERFDRFVLDVLAQTFKFFVVRFSTAKSHSVLLA